MKDFLPSIPIKMATLREGKGKKEWWQKKTVLARIWKSGNLWTVSGIINEATTMRNSIVVESSNN